MKGNHQWISWLTLLLVAAGMLVDGEAFVVPTVQHPLPLSPRHHPNKQHHPLSAPLSPLAATSLEKMGIAAFPDPPLPNFCAQCGSSNMQVRIPEGDERPRACCRDCDAVVYVNPKVVVATVVLVQDDDSLSVLLARRAIEPRLGYWGIPQGYMEMGETSRQAAVREAHEETGAVLNADDLEFRAVYNVPGSVQLVYQLVVDSVDQVPIATSTTESTEVGFFAIDELPDLCFPTVQWAIDHCCQQLTTQDKVQPTRIQQKTKFYDTTTDTWSESEDEVTNVL